MLRPIIAMSLMLAAAPVHAAAVTQPQIDEWLASSSAIVRTTVPDPNGAPRPWVQVAGSNGGFVAPQEAVDAVLGNAQEVMILPLVSGGTGGVFTALLFTKRNGRTRFVGYVPSPNGHLRITIDRGDLLIRTPIYGAASGGECCPSDVHYERATLRGLRLVIVKRWTTPLKR